MSSQGHFGGNRGGRHGVFGRGRAIAVPDVFKCLVGGEWKPARDFSKNELSKWSVRKKSANDGVTPANVGLICRIHSGAPATELRCAGPCSRWLALEKFSKTQRTQKDRWCKACVEWKEGQGARAVPGAAPNNQISPDELKEHVVTVDRPHDTTHGFDGGAGWDRELGDSEDEDSENGFYDILDSAAPSDPSEFMRSDTSRVVGGSLTGTSQTGLGNFSNFASTPRPQQPGREQPRAYNAYDTQGSQVVRAVTDASESSATYSRPSNLGGSRVTPGRKAWARPDQRKNFFEPADFATAPEDCIETYDDDDSPDEC